MSNHISKYLKKHGLTQKWMAEAVGVREATVSGWCNGVVPRPDQMSKIAVASGGEVPITSWFPADQMMPQKAAS